MRKLPENRGLLKWILLSIITFGIYNLVAMYHISEEINITAAKDGKKTMNFLLLVFIITPITLGIATLVWYHRISNRIGDELRARGIDYSFSAGTFWGWNIFGVLLAGVGPLVYMYKLLKSVNLINANYNASLAAAE